MNYNQIVGRMIKNYREAKQMTKVEMSARSGLTRKTIDAIEGGQTTTVDSLARIANALDAFLDINLVPAERVTFQLLPEWEENRTLDTSTQFFSNGMELSNLLRKWIISPKALGFPGVHVEAYTYDNAEPRMVFIALEGFPNAPVEKAKESFNTFLIQFNAGHFKSMVV